MKKEIMSKSEVWVIIALFFGLVSYSIFMFYLLAKRSKGINYFNDLYSVNSFVVYFLFFFMFFLLNQIKKYIRKKEQRIVNFISVLGAFSTGVLLASGFFTIVL